jgi:hypothetical protein
MAINKISSGASRLIRYQRSGTRHGKLRRARSRTPAFPLTKAVTINAGITDLGTLSSTPGPAVGGGTGVTVVSAYVLAWELAASSGEHVRGLAAHEQALRPAVQHTRTIGPAVLNTLIPRSRLQVWATLRRSARSLSCPRRLRRLTSFGGGPTAMLNLVKLRDPGTL